MPKDQRNLDEFCPRCGLKISKVSQPGSMTGYLFDPVKCKCQVDDPSKTVATSPHLYNLKEAGPESTYAQMAAGKGIGQATVADVLFEEGAVVGGVYRIIDLIGQGGMGVVYQARHETLGKRCALKVIPPEQVTSNSWKRFQLEAKAIAGLNHLNIVQVTDLGVHKGYLPFYAMEYVKGATLADMLAKDGPMPLDVAIEIFLQVCDGVDYAHRAGIIHRDLKPANIMVTTRTAADGKIAYTVKILDFGLAKLTGQDRELQSLTSVGDIFGSPYYMSPEQCGGEKIDNRSDIYSIGCTLFECLTGRPPFVGNLSSAVIFSQQEASPPSLVEAAAVEKKTTLKFPDSVEIIMAKLLRKNPVERYQTCRELKGDLEKIARGENVLPVYRARSAAVVMPEQGGPSSKSLIVETPAVRNGRTIALIAVATSFLVLIAVSSGSYLIIREKPKKYSINVGSLGTPRDTNLPVNSSAIDQARAVLDKSEEPVLNLNRLTETPQSIKDKTPFKLGSGRNDFLKRFNFPTDISIGTLITENGASIDQLGQAECAQNAEIIYAPSDSVVRFPSYLKRFSPGDLAGFNLLQRDDLAASLNAIKNIPGWDKATFLWLKLSDKADCSTALNGEVVNTLRAFDAVQDLRISANDGVYLSSLQLPCLMNAKTISLNLRHGTNEVINALSKNQHLVSLSVSKCDLDNSALEKIAKLPNLRYVSISRSIKSARQLAILSRSRTLTSISIPEILIDDPGLAAALGKFTNLREIFVLNVDAAREAKFEILSRSFPQFQDLKSSDNEVSVVESF